MLTQRQKLPTFVHAPENLSILMVSPHLEDVTSLRSILGDHDVRVGCCSNAAEAELKIEEDNPAAIICERDLADGNWKSVLQHAEKMAHSPLLLVVSRHADENLWAEVLNLGGYDVLLKPFERAEVTRVVGMAYRYWTSSIRSTITPTLTPQFA